MYFVQNAENRINFVESPIVMFVKYYVHIEAYFVNISLTNLFCCLILIYLFNPFQASHIYHLKGLFT